MTKESIINKNKLVIKRGIADKTIAQLRSLNYAVTEPIKLKILRRLFSKNYVDSNDEPLVSIYVPTYNRSKILIDRALNSVMSQSYKNFEFIIVGDCCTDDTELLVKKIKDKRIKFYNLNYKKKNYLKNNKYILWTTGPVVAANFALSVCKGKWVARMDDDEIWTENHIEKLLAFSQKNNLEFSSGIHEQFKEGKKILPPGFDCYGDYFDTNKLKRRIKFHNAKVGHHASWFYRSYLRFFKYNQNSWRKELNITHDLDLVVRFIKIGVEIGFLEELIGYNHPRPGEKFTAWQAVQEHGYLGLK